TPEQLSKAQKWTVTETQSAYFINRDGKFEKHVLPIEAQFAPVTNIIADDFDKDGKTDLLLLGNKSTNRLKLGNMDANYGCLLKGINNEFRYVNQKASGLSVTGDVKSAMPLRVNQQNYIVIGAFSQPLQFYKK
ncbi:MAG: RNA-binding protein, partial [Siphonobacter sp.]